MTIGIVERCQHGWRGAVAIRGLGDLENGAVAVFSCVITFAVGATLLGCAEQIAGRVGDEAGRWICTVGIVERCFNDAWKRLASEVKAQAAARQRDRAALERKIANLIDVISDGRSSPAIFARLEELEVQKSKLPQCSSQPPLLPPALHPGIAEVYAAKVSTLKIALAEGNCPEALEAARSLIDKVIVHPPKDDSDPPEIELVGELMAMLQASGLGQPQTSGGSTESDPVLALFVSSVKEDPGGWRLHVR